jgi:hypothetical protein
MDKTRTRPRLYVALAVLAAALALVASAGAARAVGNYRDATGDGRGAPDILNVTIAGDAAGGQLLFRINVDNLPSPSDALTVLGIDSDMNEATGPPGWIGTDYVFVDDESDQTYGFAHWNGSDWDWDTPYSTVNVSAGRSGVTISVNRSELGNTSGFNFWARTVRTSAPSTLYDDAPDDGTWNYSLSAGGPEIQGVLVQTSPAAGPKAGKSFRVTPVGVKLPPSGAAVATPPKPDSYSCKATLKGKALHGSGTGGCTFKVPKNARKKQLAVVVTVSYQGARSSVTYAYRVR